MGLMQSVPRDERLFDAPRHPYTRHLLECVQV